MNHLRDAVHVSVDVYGDAAVRLLDWVRRDVPDARIRQRVLHDALRKYFGETGELPPGTELLPAEDRFYVK